MLPDTARGSLGRLVGQWRQKDLAAPMQAPKPLLSQARAAQGDNAQLFFPHQD